MAHWMLYQTFLTSLSNHVTICIDGLRRAESGIRRYIHEFSYNFGYLTERPLNKTHLYFASASFPSALPFRTKHVKSVPSEVRHIALQEATLCTQRKGPPPILGQNMRDWWWTKWQYETSFFRVLLFSSATTIPKTQHIHISFIYHRRYKIIPTDGLVKLNIYHSLLSVSYVSEFELSVEFGIKRE